MTKDLPSWHPERFARRKAYLDVRQRVMAGIRSYFTSQKFAEVETPALQISPGNETHLHAFRTEFRDYARGGEVQPYYLHTSPEFSMKKLLVAGVPKLFQLAHTYRNGERSTRHHPEFMMLEWYRAHASTLEIMDDCVNLVRLVTAATGRTIFEANNMKCDPFGEWDRLTVPDAFQKYASVDLFVTMQNPHSPDFRLLANQAPRAGVRVVDGDTWEDLFFRIMGEKIEPHLGRDKPVFLCDYPVSMAALARPKPEDFRLAERFELYICGYELANAFGELTDALEQERRFKADMDMKERLYGERYPIDSDFIEALRFGMPESAGIALGVDRLVMLCAGTEDIEDVLWMPVANTVN